MSRCTSLWQTQSILRLTVLFVCFLFSAVAEIGASEQDRPLDFSRDIQPILSNHCWNCHGPDAGSREAGLRLDLRDAAIETLESGTAAIIPGKPELSELLARIESTDDSQVMPPPSMQKPLSKTQIELLKRWISEGAEYSPHWAFQVPVRPNLPHVSNVDWSRNDIDLFILQSLEDAGLQPAAAADRATWLRRVTLDLTGLSPKPAELDSFLNDTSKDAEERVVDRLLNSTQHAERMAMHWLDAARYADTNGYNNDEIRTMWPWRDWLIQAYAQGMPYDQFLTEQLAGDLLPNASLSQKVATGFNRNHVLTTEGGIIEEEYRVEYVADRVHTTATVFLGLSLQCARCHDHKFDPVTQREYYQFSAFFDNVSDRIVGFSQNGVTEIKMGEPLLKVPSPQQQAEQELLEKRRDELAVLMGGRVNQIEQELATWEALLTAEQKTEAEPDGLVASFTLDEAEGDVVTDLIAPSSVGTIHGKATRTAGKFGNAVEFDGETAISFQNSGESVDHSVGHFESDQQFSTVAWVWPSSTEASTVMSRMDESNGFRGYDVILEAGKVAAHFVHQWPDRGFKVITKEPVSLSEWHHVVVTYDGSRHANGVSIFVDGVAMPLDITNDRPLDGTLVTDKPFHIGTRGNSAGFKGKIDEVQIYSKALLADEVSKLVSEASLSHVSRILGINPTDRTAVQRDRVNQFYLNHIDAAMCEWKAESEGVRKQLADLDKAIPSVMVMSESTPRRQTYLLNRGDYDKPGEEVFAGVPEVLQGNQSSQVPDRLALARWLTHPEHPLTARVAVNRWWELCFGTGLVETSEDFGIQGTPPSHPELLDWLARELIDSGWSQREILKKIVLSATYRQSSQVTPELLERDPHNRLLARGPRYRMPVEMVRDNALAISGLLSDRIGGPSVFPYQPEGLWEAVSVERRDKYVPDQGEGLYRRSMYTFWKRTCPPPSMTVFDAPDRETCVARRSRTNTPLQALILLNDPTYVEAARKFAERVMNHSADDDSRLDFAFQQALCRVPNEIERTTLSEMLQNCRHHFSEESIAAENLLKVGYSTRNAEMETPELAAWAILCSMILNLDETISKR